jgi:hypothetical protein
MRWPIALIIYDEPEDDYSNNIIARVFHEIQNRLPTLDTLKIPIRHI